MNNPVINKYRPLLTAEDITHIQSLCRKDASNQSLSVLGKLAQFEFKINNGAIAPAMVSKGKISLEQELGFTDEGLIKSFSEDRKTLYELWHISPNQLDIKQLALVRVYRYENDLMDATEEASYESEILSVLSPGA